MTAQVTYIGASPVVNHVGLEFIKGVPQTVVDPRKIQHLKANCHFECEVDEPEPVKKAAAKKTETSD